MAHASRLAGWKSPLGRDSYRAAYESALDLWPVPYESQQISTRFGQTHAVVSGPPHGQPLILVPAAIGAGAIQWWPNVARLSAERRVYALDFVGGPGLGSQERTILNRVDCADWLLDVTDQITPDEVDLVGSSQGGWMALNAAINAPGRVRRLGLLAPAASILPIRRWVLAVLRVGPHLPSFTAAYTVKANFGGRYRPDDRFVDLATSALRHFTYQEAAVFPSVFAEVELRAMPCPTLLMIGDNELIYDAPSALERASGLLPAVTTALVSRAGHILNLEQPVVVNQHILDLLGS